MGSGDHCPPGSAKALGDHRVLTAAKARLIKWEDQRVLLELRRRTPLEASKGWRLDAGTTGYGRRPAGFPGMSIADLHRHRWPREAMLHSLMSGSNGSDRRSSGIGGSGPTRPAPLAE